MEQDFDMLMYESPTQALETWWAQKEKGLEQRYQGAKIEEEFWREFYDRNKDLKGKHHLVRAVALHHASSLQEIKDPQEMLKKVSSLVRQDIGGRGRGSASEPEQQSRETYRQIGPGLVAAKEREEAERGVKIGGLDDGHVMDSGVSNEEQWSLADEVRERRRNRRRAQNPKLVGE